MKHITESNEHQESSKQSKDNHQKHSAIPNKVYSCNFCYISFEQKKDLLKHNLHHAEERPFSCTLCDKSFAYQNTLNNHLLMHRR